MAVVIDGTTGIAGYVEDSDVQAQATWETGTGTTESLVSPAKVKSAIEALGVPYTALSKAQTGYITLSGGLIIQWGRSGAIAGGGGSTYDAFPITFPNACFTAAMSITTSTFSNTWPWTIQISNSGVTFRAHGSIAAVSGNWIAIGH